MRDPVREFNLDPKTLIPAILRKSHEIRNPPVANSLTGRDYLSRKELILEWLGFFSAASALVMAIAVFQHAWLGAPRITSQERSLATVDLAANPPLPPAAEPPRRGGYDSNVPLPPQVLLDVPFSPQAPEGDWSQPWQDACEETSVLMAMAWVRNERQPLTHPERVRREILNMVDWEIYHFGYHRDTALRETLKLSTRYFGYGGVRLAYDIRLDDIKAELARGNLVIVPAAGEVLIRENPYYASPPPYHMLVVRGYDDARGEVIVNDPGTKRGGAFRYSYRLFAEAIHDWTGDEAAVLEGRSGMIVVSRNSEG